MTGQFNVAVSIVVLISNILLFQKTCFKIKVLKAFETSSDVIQKYIHIFNRGLFYKIRITVFRGTEALSVGFKNSHFVVKFVGQSNRSFSFILCWFFIFIFFFYPPCLNILIFNWIRTFYHNQRHVRANSVESWKFNWLFNQ